MVLTKTHGIESVLLNHTYERAESHPYAEFFYQKKKVKLQPVQNFRKTFSLLKLLHTTLTDLQIGLQIEFSLAATFVMAPPPHFNVVGRRLP